MKFKQVALTSLIALGIVGGLSSCGKVNGPTIGILKWVGADALNEAERGFVDGLKENGYEAGVNLNIDYRDAKGKSADAASLASSLLRGSDLTLGIATPSATTLHAMSEEMGLSKPILFTAVTDAEDAGLVESNEAPGGYITGTSDMNPVELQIDLIQDALPSISKLGIAYTQGETNSKIQADRAKDQAESLGIEVSVSTCSNATDIPQVLNNLSNSVDALYIPTDNNLADNMPAVFNNSNNKLICAGEVNQVKNGAHISLSVDYYKLGKQTGEMAAKILKNEINPATTAVKTMGEDECEYVYSSTWCQQSGITLPDEVIAKCRNVNA